MTRSLTPPIGRALALTSRIFIAAVFLALVFAAPSAPALEFPAKPDEQNWFVDEAGLIDQQAASKINEIASTLFAVKSVPIYVVTITSLADYDAAGYSIEGYAADLFDEWGVGFDDFNYGMLLLVSEGDRKARIELGAEWGRSYDRQAKQVMDDLIIPNFKSGDFSGGIVNGVEGMDAMARGEEIPAREAPWWSLPLLILIAVFFAVLIYNLFKTGRSGWAWALIAFLAVALFFILRNAPSGSGAGFGGGSSGGGGATGSW